MISYGASRNVMFLQLSSEAKCEGECVGWHDRSWAHKVAHAIHRPTLTSEYYLNQILEKDLKPLTSRHLVTGGPIERKLFSSKKEMTFVQDRASAHTSKATLTCVKRICQTL